MKTIFLALITLMFLGSGFVYAGTYLDSAHGTQNDAITGVERLSEYSADGHCAHCHEQHASIDGNEPSPTGGPDDYLLFRTHYTSQTDTVCYDCHGTGTAYTSGITNYSYSKNFGGNTADYDSTIEVAFGHTVSGSSHYLPNIVTQILNVTNLVDAENTSWQLSGNDDPSLNPKNPCDACHNPHLAKRSCNLPGSYDPTKSAISRPSDHNNLWGDGTDERMSSYNYQPPYWDSDKNSYEPGGGAVAATSKANTPDYIKFCTDCHNPNNTITSSNPRIDATPRTLTKIDWSTDGDKHGARSATEYITTDSPYTAGSGSLGYVLSCLDCHEPHGSTNNVFLIRTEVNDTNLAGSIISFSTTSWQYLCARCHIDDNRDIHHNINDRSYIKVSQSCDMEGCHPSGTNTISCTNCHYHGSSKDNCTYAPATRITF